MIRIATRSLVLIGLLGGIGGAINAWLCLARFPVPAAEDASFAWHVIPAGGAHGALLAMIGVGASVILWRCGTMARWVVVPVVGWIAGWLSFVPLSLSVFKGSGNFIQTFLWPFQPKWEALWSPWFYFGLVAAVLFLLLNSCRQLVAGRLVMHLVVGVLSGSLGSLWWWIAWKPWYFSLLHGTIWGALVGYGVWRAQHHQRPQPA